MEAANKSYFYPTILYLQQDERQVRQYQITNWSDHNDTPDSCDALLRILELTRQWTYDQGNTPIVVHCRYVGVNYVVEILYHQSDMI